MSVDKRLPCAVQIEGALAPGVLIVGTDYRVASVDVREGASKKRGKPLATVITFEPIARTILFPLDEPRRQR